MALGTVDLKAEFKSENSIQYKIEIYAETGGSGVGVTFDLGPDGFILTYKGQGKQRYDTIKESTLEFEMYVVSSGSINNFYTTFNSKTQGHYKVKVSRSINSGTTYSPYWYGVLLQDIMTATDEDYPKKIKLKATDGLSLMKDIPFDRDVYNGTVGNLNTLYTIKNIVGNMLKFYLGGTQDFYSSTDTFWYEMIHWYENSMTTPGGSHSPWESSALYPNAFRDIEYEENNPVKTESISAYDTLKSILEAFGARIFQARGQYWIVHHDMWFNNSANHAYRRYNKNGTELGGGTLPTSFTFIDLGNATDSEPLTKLSGGTTSFYPPLKQTSAIYGNWTNAGLFSDSIDLIEYTTIANMESTLVDLGYIEAASAYLNINQKTRQKKLSGTAASAGTPPNAFAGLADYINVVYMLKIGSYYWDGANGVWTTTQTISEYTSMDSAFNMFFTPNISTDQWAYSQITFNTLALPVSGELKLNARFIQGNPLTDDGQPTGTVEYGCQIMAHTAANTSRIQYTTDGQTPFERKFVTNDANSTANETIELKNLRIGDGPTTSQPSWGRIRVYNGSSWLNTVEEDWQAWQTGTQARITQILTEQHYSGQRNFVEKTKYKFVITSSSIFNPLTAITDKTESGDPVMVMNGFKFIANKDEVQGEFYKTAFDPSAVTNTFTEVVEVTYTPGDLQDSY